LIELRKPEIEIYEKSRGKYKWQISGDSYFHPDKIKFSPEAIKRVVNELASIPHKTVSIFDDSNGMVYFSVRVASLAHAEYLANIFIDLPLCDVLCSGKLNKNKGESNA
jgi:hypothetical protein